MTEDRGESWYNVLWNDTMTAQKRRLMKNFEQEYILINGIEHYILHYPKGPKAPVLLYLHGGPGSVESLFAWQLNEVWGNLFTQVHWDQRGAGKTLRRNKNNGLPQSMEQMLEDLHGVIGHLKQKYQVEKIVLLGHSWGSLLGSLYTLRHSENVLAYVGVGQVVSMAENERTAYEEVLSMARKEGNQKDIRALEQLSGYPPMDPEQLLKLLPTMRKIQGHYDHGPVSGNGLGETLKILRRSPIFQWGDLACFMKIMTVNRPLHLQMMSFDLRETLPHYEVPVHYILGELDPIAPTSLARAYFDSLDAPEKTFSVIAGAGHNPMNEKPEEFAEALRAVWKTFG